MSTGNQKYKHQDLVLPGFLITQIIILVLGLGHFCEGIIFKSKLNQLLHLVSLYFFGFISSRSPTSFLHDSKRGRAPICERVSRFEILLWMQGPFA